MVPGRIGALYGAYGFSMIPCLDHIRGVLHEIGGLPISLEREHVYNEGIFY